MYKEIKGGEITGELDIFKSKNEILIHGNPAGLKSLAKLLLEIAELDQEQVEDKFLPVGAREHYHLRPGIELSKSSNEVIVGRLDAKGTGEFYERFVPADLADENASPVCYAKSDEVSEFTNSVNFP